MKIFKAFPINTMRELLMFGPNLYKKTLGAFEHNNSELHPRLSPNAVLTSKWDRPFY